MSLCAGVYSTLVKMPSGGGGSLTAIATALVTLVCSGSALDTGIQAATLCCGTDCVDLAQEFPDAWRARNDNGWLALDSRSTTKEQPSLPFT